APDPWTTPVSASSSVNNPSPERCSEHPFGWHHDDPCHTCRRMREEDERRRATNDPRCPHGIPRGADLDDHGTSLAGCVRCERDGRANVVVDPAALRAQAVLKKQLTTMFR